MPAARPQLIRAMNEQVMLDYIRRAGPLSRADLARISGLSKPTVSLALANIERAGLVQPAGHRTGVPGPAAILYEVRPEAGYVLGLDIGRQYIRGAISDLAHRNVLAAAGGLLLKPALGGLRHEFDPDTTGGAILLGLRSIAIVGHGSSGAEGVANAVRLAARTATVDAVGRTAALLREGHAGRAALASDEAADHLRRTRIGF